MRVQTKSTHEYEESRVLFTFDLLQFSADLLITIPLTVRQPSRCLQCVLIFTPNYLSLSGAFTKLRNTISIFMSVCRYVLPNDWASRSASSQQCAYPFHSSHAGFFCKASHHLRLSDPRLPYPHPPFRFVSLRLLAFSKTKIAVEREVICECDGHTIHKLSQRRLTADWLDPRVSDWSRMHSKVSSDWLPSYIKATRPVLDIFKVAWCFPDSLRTYSTLDVRNFFWYNSLLVNNMCVFFRVVQLYKTLKVHYTDTHTLPKVSHLHRSTLNFAAQQSHEKFTNFTYKNVWVIAWRRNYEINMEVFQFS